MYPGWPCHYVSLSHFGLLRSPPHRMPRPVAAGSLPRADRSSRRLRRLYRSVVYIFGRFMLPEPGLGVVGDAPVDGDVLVEGDALVDGPQSGDTVGDGVGAGGNALV